MSMLPPTISPKSIVLCLAFMIITGFCPAQSFPGDADNTIGETMALFQAIDKQLSPATLKEINVELQKVRQALEQADYEGLDIETDLFPKVIEAERLVRHFGQKIGVLITAAIPAIQKLENCESIGYIEELTGTGNRQNKKRLNELIQISDKINSQLHQLHQEYQVVADDLLQIKYKSEWEDRIDYVLASPNPETLAKVLLSSLIAHPGVDPLSTVRVQFSSNPVISYETPCTGSTYKLGEQMDRHTIFSRHIVERMQELQQCGLTIDSIRLSILFQDATIDLQAIPSGHYYMEEFGNSVEIPIQTFDTESNAIAYGIVIVEQGKVPSVIEMASLKLHGMRKYLGELGLVEDVIAILRLSSPHYDLANSQTLMIELFTEYSRN